MPDDVRQRWPWNPRIDGAGYESFYSFGSESDGCQYRRRCEKEKDQARTHLNERRLRNQPYDQYLSVQQFLTIDVALTKPSQTLNGAGGSSHRSKVIRRHSICRLNALSERGQGIAAHIYFRTM